MRSRMRIATLLGAVSICLTGTGAAVAGPTQPSDALLSSQANDVHDTPAIADTGDMLTSNQDEQYLDIQLIGQSANAGSPSGAPNRPLKATHSSPSATSDTPGAGIWHPGLEDGQLLAAPVSLSSNVPVTANPADNPIIPLPNAAWTGLTMLLLLAIVRFFRNFRRLLT